MAKKAHLLSTPAKLIILAVLLSGALVLVSCGKSSVKSHHSSSGNKTSSSSTKAKGKDGSSLLKTAEKYIGTPYKYGGCDPSGFDCSGFMFFTHKQHGITIPRTAKEQSKGGKAVARKNLKVGDVVAFKLPSTYHVGMYTGKGTFIHSPRTGTKIREESLDSSYWKKYYIGARRYASN